MEKILENLNPSKNLAYTLKSLLKPICLGILSFFAARTVVFETLNPISLAVLGSFCFSGGTFYFMAFCSILGIITKLTGINAIKYIMAISITAIINVIMSKHEIKNKAYIQTGTAAFACLLPGLSIAVLNNFSFYYTIVAILEAILVFSLTFILKKGTAVFLTERKEKIITNEEFLSLSILVAAVIAGSANVYIGNINLMYFFMILSSIFVAYQNGSAAGASAGLMLSFILALSGRIPTEAVCIIGVCSAFCGFVKDFGKIASAAVFFVIGIISCFYLTPSFLNIEMLFSSVSALLVFCLIPKDFFISLSSAILNTEDSSAEYVTRIKEITGHKLKGFSLSFSKLAKTFNSLSEKRMGLSQNDISTLIDNVAAKVCTNCGMHIFCWKNNFYKTYQTVFGILAACESKGFIDADDIPDSFAESCINVKEFAQTTNQLFELCKLNLKWQNKITENRQLISRQLFGIAEIVDKLYKEINTEFKFKDDLIKRLKNELLKHNIKPDSLSVTENPQNRLEVIIKQPSCYNRGFCTKQLIPLVSDILEVPMSKSCYGCTINKADNKSICRLKLVEEQKFRITTGYANAAKEGSRSSGDSYTYMDLGNGSYLLAISDGMGSGAKAREESSAAVELFEDFMEAGFDKNIALDIINSVLVLKSNNDCFSTLDICTFDLYTAVAEFVKISAAPTFIIRENRIDEIKCTSLPVGILNDIDTETNKKRLHDSDIIVMVTDGILDSAQDKYQKESWLFNLLKGCNLKDPQKIADFILEKALENCKNKPTDDMTVLTARVWEKLI